MSKAYELIIKNTQQPCKLTDLMIDVSCSGFLAQTTVTMVFLNETDNETEGEVNNLKINTYYYFEFNINNVLVGIPYA